MYKNEPQGPWITALERVARSRSSRIHMPAALLVSLDIVDTAGAFEFAMYEQRFKAIMNEIRPKAANSAWAPFYHLSTKSDIWDLFLGDEKADFSGVVGSPMSRSRVVKRADRARFKNELSTAFSKAESMQAIRDSIYDLLRQDADSDADKLIQLCAARTG